MATSGRTSGSGWEEEDIRSERSFLIYQTALARRRIEDIMKADDLAMVLYLRELNFVHTVLSSLDSLLRREVRNGKADNDSTDVREGDEPA